MDPTPTPTPTPTPEPSSATSDGPAGASGPGRRSFLRAGGLAGGGLVVGGVIGAAVGRGTADGSTTGKGAAGAGGVTTPDLVTRAETPVAFHGQHQAGIVGAAPAQLRFLALDLAPELTAGLPPTPGGDGANPAPRAEVRTAVRSLLQRLSAAAQALTAGEWIGEQLEAPAGLRPSALTVTLALGARAVAATGQPIPAAMAPIPAFAGDELVAARSGGDLGLQICGDDPFVVASAAQALAALAAPTATPRWVQTGFQAGLAATGRTGTTPRNLMGQLDGTDNPTGSPLELAVWVSDTDTSWLTDGTYLVCRRIRMLLPAWRKLPAADREQVIGRTLTTGAPLTGGTEHSTPNFTAVGAGNRPVIAADAHLRLTHPANNSAATMLRRGYSYDDGLREDGQPDAGLFFQSFQTDPRQVFVPIQRKLAAQDALSRFIRHESSALFAVLPGASSTGAWLGETMFA